MANVKDQDQVWFDGPLPQPQLQAQPFQPELQVVDAPETEAERRDYLFLIKAKQSCP